MLGVWRRWWDRQEAMREGGRSAAHRPGGGHDAAHELPPPRPAGARAHTGANTRPGMARSRWSQPISRVLSWTVIRLGHASPHASSDLPGGDAGHAIAPLFGLAPGGVYLAATCCHARGALLPHLFTLTSAGLALRRFVFCGTFRRLAPPRHYLAPCPVEPGLSSVSSMADSDCLANSA